MYGAFDSYLAPDTWHTSHPYDDQRFYRALARVVRDPDFNPDRMGEYLFQKTGVDRENRDDTRGRAIEHRVTEAWAIKHFLETNGW